MATTAGGARSLLRVRRFFSSSTSPHTARSCEAWLAVAPKRNGRGQQRYSFFSSSDGVTGGKDEYDLAEFAAYDEENVDEGAGAAANKDKKESEK
jgi:hypothetical protein